MSELLEQIDGMTIAEALANTLESMAFISVAPAEYPYVLPEDAALFRMRFEGPRSGTIEMIAPRKLGRTLLEQMTGGAGEPTDAEAIDALREMLNVIAGAILRQETGRAQYEMSLPSAEPVVNLSTWAAFTQPGGVPVIDAEGHIIAMKVHTAR